MTPVRKILLFIIFTLSLILLIRIGYLFTHQIACEGQPFNDNLSPTTSQQILGERLIGQSFTSPRDDLNRIDIFFQTYGRQNTSDVYLRLLEIPPDNGNLLQGNEVFSTVFDAATLQDRSWSTFAFSPISGSVGKTYLLTLQSPASKDGNAITVGGIQQNVYMPGFAIAYAPDLGFSDLTPINGDIMFRACYEMTTFEKLKILAEQITQNRPYLWGNANFYVLSFGVYTLLVVGLFWKLIKLPW